MGFFHVLAGCLVLTLLVYLVVAMLWPEAYQ